MIDIYLTYIIPIEDIDLDTDAKTIEPLVLPHNLGTRHYYETICFN